MRNSANGSSGACVVSRATLTAGSDAARTGSGVGSFASRGARAGVAPTRFESGVGAGSRDRSVGAANAAAAEVGAAVAGDVKAAVVGAAVALAATASVAPCAAPCDAKVADATLAAGESCVVDAWRTDDAKTTSPRATTTPAAALARRRVVTCEPRPRSFSASARRMNWIKRSGLSIPNEVIERSSLFVVCPQ